MNCVHDLISSGFISSYTSFKMKRAVSSDLLQHSRGGDITHTHTHTHTNSPVAEVTAQSKQVLVQFLNWFLLQNVVDPATAIESPHLLLHPQQWLYLRHFRPAT